MLRLTLKANSQEELAQMIAEFHATFNCGDKPANAGGTVISNMEAEKPKATRTRKPKEEKEPEKVEGVDEEEKVEPVKETVKAKTVEADKPAFDYEVLKAKVLSFSKDPANRSALLGILKKFGVDHATKLNPKDWKAAYDAIVEAEEANADLA